MRFFFYGTLGEGMDNPTITAIRPRLGPARAAATRGALFALPDRDGWYPGLLPDPGGAAIRGVLYEPGADFTAADLARLDAYEAFDPARPEASEYIRRAIEVEPCGEMGTEPRQGGEWLSAEAYVYNRPLPPGARPIAQGSFAAFLAANGVRALAPRDP